MGAASRKRKWEIAAERGLIPPLGHSPESQFSYGSHPSGYITPPARHSLPGPTQRGGAFAGKGGFAGNTLRGRPPVASQARRGGGKTRIAPAAVPPVDTGADDEVGLDIDGEGVEQEEEQELGDDGTLDPPALAVVSKRAGYGRSTPAGAPGRAVASPLVVQRRGGRQPIVPARQASVKWVTLPESAPFVQSGLPELGPAVFYNAELQPLLTSAQYILADLGVASEAVVLTHDPDWNIYPDVAEAIKQAGGEEQCLCVAECPDRSMWAVGTASKWKHREQAARLAICVALAANVEDFDSLAVAHPEFTALCESVGIVTGSQHVPMPASRPLVVVPQGKAKKWKQQPAEAAGTGDGGTGAQAALGGPGFPRDVPFWVTLADDEATPDVLDGLPMEALALTTQGTGRKALYSKADAAIAKFVGDPATEVVYHDDPNWDLFPAVGNALKRVANAEECLCVAVCTTTSVWAVGVGMKGKNRLSAAKVALAAALALQAAEVGEEVDFADFPALADFVEEARAAKNEGL